METGAKYRLFSFRRPLAIEERRFSEGNQQADAARKFREFDEN